MIKLQSDAVQPPTTLEGPVWSPINHLDISNPSALLQLLPMHASNLLRTSPHADSAVASVVVGTSDQILSSSQVPPAEEPQPSLPLSV